MTRSEIIRSLRDEYSKLREANQREQERRIKEVNQKDPQIKKITDTSYTLLKRQTLLMLSRPAEAEIIAQETHKQIALLRAKLEEHLQAVGFPKDYLDPIYSCKRCRDMGYIDNGVRTMCTCMEQKFNKRTYQSVQERVSAKQSFSTFNENIFPNDVTVDGINTQRKIAIRARNMCYEYASTYPNTDTLNLLMTGASGLGKTFLLHCIENYLIDKGFSPISITAYRLFEAMRGNHYGKEEKQQEFEQLTQCDILLIDDLGTEPFMQNVTREYLFSLLNERMARQRRTVIATNLAPKELHALYGERVFSRLFDTLNVTPIYLRGCDLRLQMGRDKK